MGSLLIKILLALSLLPLLFPIFSLVLFTQLRLSKATRKETGLGPPQDRKKHGSDSSKVTIRRVQGKERSVSPFHLFTFVKDTVIFSEGEEKGVTGIGLLGLNYPLKSTVLTGQKEWWWRIGNE